MILFSERELFSGVVRNNDDFLSTQKRLKMVRYTQNLIA